MADPYILIPVSIMERKDLTPEHKVIIGAFHTWDHPTAEFIAVKVGLSHSIVSKLMADLIQRGEIAQAEA
jgi:DNA-binding MarR family transcriptional regulator